MTRLTALLLAATATVGLVEVAHNNAKRAPAPGPRLVAVPDVSPTPGAIHRGRVTRSNPRRTLAPVIPIRSHRWDVTAYCATGNRTASGAWPRVGMAATLSRRIPFGTRLRVPGVGVVTVTDRIGHSSDLDLYMGAGPACQRAALAWGRRHLTVVEVSQ